MPTSVFLAKLIGPVLLAVGVGLLANAAAYRSSPTNSCAAPR